MVPPYPADWTVYCLSGPHCDAEFVTDPGIEAFFGARWKVSTSSNRMGIRLEGPKIDWARPNGGEGGSHPSNIHDNGYAYGTINVNGDTPVILTNEGPDMGGYMCICTVITAEMSALFIKPFSVHTDPNFQVEARPTASWKHCTVQARFLRAGNATRSLDDRISGPSVPPQLALPTDSAASVCSALRGPAR